MAILEELHPLTGHGRYIFHSERTPRCDWSMSDNTLKAALRRLGYGKDVMTVSVDCLFEKGGGRRFITVPGNHEINRVAEFINGAIQVNPLAFDFNVGFIQSPRRCSGPFTFFGFYCDGRVIVDNSAVKCGMIHFNATLRPDFL